MVACKYQLRKEFSYCTIGIKRVGCASGLLCALDIQISSHNPCMIQYGVATSTGQLFMVTVSLLAYSAATKRS